MLVWQAAATLIIAVIAGLWAGGHGALSAVLGGVVNMSAGVVYAFVLAVAPGQDGRRPPWWRCSGPKLQKSS